jgi:hypothetical protein
MLQEEGSRSSGGRENGREKTVQEELADFYRRHDPSKVDKVDRLFQKFSFDDIRASVMRKYGSLPRGWSNDTIQLDVKVASSEQVCVCNMFMATALITSAYSTARGIPYLT